MQSKYNHILSIIIPCYNEHQTIYSIFDKLKYEFNLQYVQIIIVDDGSSDGTTQIIKEIELQNDNIKCIYKDVNQGKTQAIREGLKYADGKYTIIQDADLEYSPYDINRMLIHATKYELEVLYGSRRLKKTDKRQNVYRYGGQILSLIFNILFEENITDITTCYKMILTDQLKNFNISENGFNYCFEVSCKVRINGKRIEEIPINYLPRNKTKGKKIKYTDGLSAIEVIFRYWFKLIMKR